MRDDTRQFYESIRLHEIPPAPAAGVELPITYYKIFHKRYPRLPRVALPEPAAGGEFHQLLGMRKSSRAFSSEPLRLAELAEVLRSCRILSADSSIERRTYPSGGARFPVEIYPIVFRTESLTPGCYHYDMEQSALERLWEQDLAPRSYEFTSQYIENAAVQLIFTSVIARSEVKYGARAYPYSLLEAGHMAQNISLAATRLGLGFCPIGGFVDDSVAEVLDLTADEIPIYSLSLGKVEAG